MEIRIVQQNLDGCHNRCDVEKLMDQLLGEEPDVLMLSEFSYNKHKDTVIDRLESKGYEIIYPKGYRVLYDTYRMLDGKLVSDERKIIDGEYLTLDDKHFSQNLFENFCDDEDALEKLLESDNTDLVNLVEKLYYDDNLKEPEKRQLRDLIFDLYEADKRNGVTDHRRGNTFCVCVLAVRKRKEENNEEVKFNFDREQSQILPKCDLRYITGVLTATTAKKRKEIKIYFTHISSGGKREERKREMLRAAYRFCADNKDGDAFIGGDFNSDIRPDIKKTELWVIFRKLCEIFEDTEDTKGITYIQDPTKPEASEKSRFDYALASESLKDNCKCKTKIIDTTIYGTDHKALRTTIEF